MRSRPRERIMPANLSQPKKARSSQQSRAREVPADLKQAEIQRRSAEDEQTKVVRWSRTR